MIISIILLLSLSQFQEIFVQCQYADPQGDYNQNIYQFIQQLLKNNNYELPQNNPNIYANKKHFPDIINQGNNEYPGQITVNLNQPESKPTTVVNNNFGKKHNNDEYCPCGRYIRLQTNSLPVCLCPMQRIFAKCETGTVCVLKGNCNNGVTLDSKYSQDDLCDESTSICCVSKVHSKLDSDSKIINHFFNSTIGHLNNSVNKYVVSGNLYLNNENQETNSRLGNTNEKLQPQQLNNQNEDNVQIPVISTSTSSDLIQNFEEDIQPTTYRPDQVSTKRPKIDLIRPTRPSTFSNKFKPVSEPISKIVSPVFENVINSQLQSSEEKNEDDLKISLEEEIKSVFPQSTELPIIVIETVEQTTLPVDTTEENRITIGLDFPGLPESLINQTVPNPNEVTTEEVKRPFFSGKVEQLKNLKKMNATVGFMKKMATTITNRIYKINDTTLNKSIESYPYERAKNDEEVVKYMESVTNFQEYEIPPASSKSQFSAPPTTEVVSSSSPALTTSSSPVADKDLTSTINENCPTNYICIQTMFCTADGLISNVPVTLSPDEESRRAMLLDCGNRISKQTGKCCTDFV